MKVLFDCILTAEPAKCSTNIQFVTLSNILLKHPDMFIYWPIPDSVTPEQALFYPQDARIKYIRVHQYPDRMKEYMRLPPHMEDLLAVNGSTWDWDVLVTVRTPQVPAMRLHCNSVRTTRQKWMRKIIVIEDMMMLSKKPTVAQSDPEVQDRMTLEGYLASDITLCPAYHQKKWAMEVARDHFSFASLKTISHNFVECCQLELSKHPYGLKTKHKFDGSRKLGVAFVGRLERFGTRLDVMNGLLKNQYILHDDKVRTFICTVTKGDTFVDTDAIEVLHPQREEFWRISREEMDVALAFSIDVELTLSKLEPLMFGVPLIIVKAPWSVGMVGEDYPFFVKTETEAFALIGMFKDNYEACYDKFTKWYNEWFIPEYTRREQEDGMYMLLERETINFNERLSKLPDGYKDNAIVQLIAEHGGQEFHLKELLETLLAKKLVGREFVDKLTEGDREKRGLTWTTNFNLFRLALKHFFNYEDASVALGHMRLKN